MDTILSLINEYRVPLAAVLLLLVTIVAIYKWWGLVSLWWLQLRCSIPVVGKDAVYARRTDFDTETQWFNGEKNLCEAYLPHYENANAKASPEFFDNCKSYLRKTRELGRKNLPLIGWAGLAIMIFLEAMGFSYVLAGWTIPGASEHLKQQGAVGIALLISSILVIMTHFTGHELHHNSLIENVNAWWRRDSGDTDKQPNTSVSLERDQVDRDDKPWRQLLSRIPSNAHVTRSLKMTILTFILIVLVGSGATYVRGQVLEQQMAAQHRLSNAGSSYNDDPYANAAPQELSDSQAQVDDQVDDAVESAERKGGWVTFIVLAVIFVFLQVIGIIIGYKTGFAGIESSDAHEFIRRFNTREEFANYHQQKRDHIVRVADKHLGQVQSKMAARPEIDREKKRHLDNPGGRHFREFIQAFDRQGEPTPHQTQRPAETQPTPAAQSEAASVGAAARDVAPQDSEVVLDEAEIQSWMERLGWHRERTVERLTQAKRKQITESAKSTPVSDEEADRVFNEQFGQ